MAQQQPAPAPAQAQPQSQPQSQLQPTARRETTPIDALQGTMNLLLTVIGQSLHQPSRLRDPQQRLKMQSVFPTANLRFHEALDRMEEDIAMMQNIVKRDLALKRVLEKQRKEQPVKEEEKAEEEVLVQDMQDVVMGGGEEEREEKKAPTTRVMEPVKVEEQVQPAPVAPMVAPAPSIIQATTTAPDTTKPATTTGTTVATAAGTATTTTTAEEANASLDPTADAADEMDFSEFFGDDLLPTADDTADAQLGTTLPDFGDATNADVSSLLPGLDDYANIPDDAAMPDVPVAPAAASAPEATEFNFGDLTAGTATTAVTTTNAVQDNVNATAQQQQNNDVQPDFGDLDFSFDTGPDLGGGGGGGGGIGGDGDNTFADLFDMDSYDFGGGGGSAGGGGDGQDINDWMKSL